MLYLHYTGLKLNLLNVFVGGGYITLLMMFLHPLSNFNQGSNTVFVYFVQMNLEKVIIYFKYSSNHISEETVIR